MPANPEDVDTESVEPSAFELYLRRKERMFADKAKHASAHEAGIAYFFPIFRKIAKQLADQEELIADLQDAVSVSGGVGAVAIRALQESNNFILQIAGLLDTAMVAGGLVEVTDKGLKPTDKGNSVPGLLKAYSDMTEQTRNIAVSNKNAIEAIQEAIDDEEDEPEDDEPEGDEDDPTVPARGPTNGEKKEGGSNASPA